MPSISPFRAWRYNSKLNSQIGELTSPLFDVISDKQRAILYQNKLNSIHLSVPSAEETVETTAALLRKWKVEKILEQDQIPAIYVYFQHYFIHGSSKPHVRKGFIATIDFEKWDNEVILRHESTLPGSVNDRTELLEKTKFNVSPTHGLYIDPLFQIEEYLDVAMRNPIYEIEDYQGVKDCLAKIEDPLIISEIQQILKNQPIILADGHHRLEATAAYLQRLKKNNASKLEYDAGKKHLMYFTNTESDDTLILPTHRVIKHPICLLDNFPDLLASFFSLKEVEDPLELSEMIAGKPGAFGLIWRDRYFKIKLKPEYLHSEGAPVPDTLRFLDVTYLHFFVFQKVLSIPFESQSENKAIKYDRNLLSCVRAVQRKEADAAFILNEISIETVKNVCKSGYTLPPKTTYFYPKVVTGLVFSSIDPDEN